jgi:hypothetical protein
MQANKSKECGTTEQLATTLAKNTTLLFENGLPLTCLVVNK